MTDLTCCKLRVLCYYGYIVVTMVTLWLHGQGGPGQQGSPGPDGEPGDNGDNGNPGPPGTQVSMHVNILYTSYTHQ